MEMCIFVQISRMGRYSMMASSVPAKYSRSATTVTIAQCVLVNTYSQTIQLSYTMYSTNGTEITIFFDERYSDIPRSRLLKICSIKKFIKKKN